MRATLAAILTAALALAAQSLMAADDIIIADFEGDDYGGWKMTGEAFGKGPAQGPIEGQMPVDGFMGKGYSNSYHGGDKSTGTLVFPAFKIERRYLEFLIGGGGYAEKTCINLRHLGKVVRTATGPNTRPGGSERLSWQFWDVADLNGKEVVLEIVDHATEGWGHINVDHIALSDTLPPSPQAQFIKDAEAFLESKAAIAGKDPLRPIYHVMPKSQSIGDPNGPVFYNGEYHIFYQGMPYWGTSKSATGWGHAVSKDMVHWEHLPMAMAPGPGSYDSAGVWSGGCVINNGVPTIIYSGNDASRRGQAQCIATSSDNLRTWIKDPANPVIPALPPIEGLDPAGFRDPFTWREGNEWRILVGAGYAKSKGGTLLLYRSRDLRKWDFLGTLCEGMGENCFMWECPTFFPMGNQHMLIVSPLFRNVPGLRGFTQYATGTYRNNRFEAGEWKPLDLAGPRVFYAATSFADPKNRRILWGFIMTAQQPAAGWSNCLSLPRLVTSGKDGHVSFAPLPELTALRTRERDCGSPVLKQDEELVLDPALGLHGELAIEIDMSTADKIELRVGRTADGASYVPLSYDKTSGNLVFGNKNADFQLDADKRLRIHLFTDGVVAEAFINDKVCFSSAMPVTEKSVGLSIVSSKGTARITGGRLWQMTSIW